MEISAILLRWYRSFNVATLGPNDPEPPERWHTFRGELFPFVTVPLDKMITTVVGANESGKSHLLSAVAKVINGVGLPGPAGDEDLYDIKDICRYCGFSALDDGVWPEIGLQLSVSGDEVALFEQSDGPGTSSDPVVGGSTVTVLLHGGSEGFATAYVADAVTKRFDRDEWYAFARTHLPSVSVLDSRLALPNQVHIDELLDLYRDDEPLPVVDALAVQDLWREIKPIEVGAGNSVDQATVQRLHGIKTRIEAATKGIAGSEQELVHLLFSGVLGVKLDDLERIRKYTEKERGYVSWVNEEINGLIDRELDIARYWDQDEEFRLSVNYKAGIFHFQITDRTGTTYTFNERSSGLRYFLSYYVQAKAVEKLEHQKGVMILMDEPDSFLSASGQRSLLRVFDALVSHKTAHAACQLVYTTHSPFLINRNFPDRIKLVRKGDGNEGTQFVPRASVRRFEPVRSALSIDAADTLFLGSTNIVVEGYGDQLLLTACVQRFGVPGKLEDVLDLNAVTLVAAGGAPQAPDLVRKALKGDERPPIVVVLLDGDSPGDAAAREVATLIDPKQVCTLREVDLGAATAEVLEDIVPAAVLDQAIQAYLRRLGLTCSSAFREWSVGGNNAERIESFLANNVEALKAQRGSELRFGVVSTLAGLLGDSTFHSSELAELRRNAESVFRKIAGMVDFAERNARRQSLKKQVRLQIDTFLKRFPRGASKGDIRRLLDDLTHVASDRTEDAENARKNAERLLQQLDLEAQSNSDAVQIERWRTRLQRLRNEPWANVPDWSKVAAPAVPQPPAGPLANTGSASAAPAH